MREWVLDAGMRGCVLRACVIACVIGCVESDMRSVSTV